MTHESTLRREIAVEQQYLDRVHTRLAQLRRDAQTAEREGYRIAETDHAGADLGPESPLTTALVERDAMVHHAAHRRARLDAAHDGLVFGRLDRRDGAVEYVGRLGIRDPDAGPLVIDWRAPAAADFYRATATDPRGVVRRRAITSRAGTVTGLEDDLLDPAAELPVVGDGALLAGLSRATGSGMRDIVATIQREQDAAIRSPATGVAIVEGGPGTGKTAVALHRVAYLLYRDRSRFAGRGILVVGPTPVFTTYIASVLPSLGERSATLRALGELADGVSAARVDPAPVAAVKGSLRMLAVLRRAVRAQVPGAPTQLRLAWHGALLRLDAHALERIRRRALSGRRRRNEARRAAFDAVFDALWEDVGSQLPGYRGRRADFEDEISDRREFRDFLRAWWPLLRPRRVLAWLADPDRLAGFGRGVLSAAEVSTLAGTFAEVAASGSSIGDVALLDELDALLGGPPGAEAPWEFAHVVVDEAQDVSPMQWRMLGRRGRRASWTVVGDPAQRAWTGDPDELARARNAALHGPRHTHTLTTNYRNPVEVFAWAASEIRRVAPDAPLPTPVRSAGVDPTDRTVPADALPDAVVAATATLRDQVEGTVGVITPVPRRDEVAGWLAELPQDGRVQVVTSLEAKGMEYDGVVLVEPGELPDSRTRYVALSRATQRLTTVATAPWRAEGAD